MHADEIVPEWIAGGPARLRHVLVDQVRNAVKFTADGRVDVGLSLRESEAGAETLRIAVHDTGIGIEPGARERLGFDVSIANNGLEAVHATDERAFDIVFMDCQMPVMDGYEAMKRIRARSEQRGALPPVLIALTADALEGDRERCIEAGADDYVAKPLVMDELIRALRRAANRRLAA